MEKGKFTLSGEEKEIIQNAHKSGIKNPTSLVSLLYSKGKGDGISYTELKKAVSKEVGIFEVFKSVSHGENGEAPIILD